MEPQETTQDNDPGSTPKTDDSLPETTPLLGRRASRHSHRSRRFSSAEPEQPPKTLSTRNAFSILVSMQIGSGIFASPAQVDRNVPSPGVALLIWVLGGLLSWTGAASFAEFGATLPLNGGTQEYLRYVYGDTMAFLMAWIYIVAVRPSGMAIQSIIIAECVASIVGGSPGLSPWALKGIAFAALLTMVLANSINTRTTMRLSESFAAVKILTVLLVVLGGFTAFAAHFVNPDSSLSGSKDWYSRNWFHARSTVSNGERLDWKKLGTWDMLGHYTAAIYAGLWAYDGWDNANFVASEIKNPGRALPLAIKAAMTVVLSCYELVNVAYYILLPWDTLSANDAVAVAAAKSLLGRWGGIVITILVAMSCAGSITSNLFALGRSTVAASQRGYLPRFLGLRGISKAKDPEEHESAVDDDESNGNHISGEDAASPWYSVTLDAPLRANLLAVIIVTPYILLSNFPALLLFVGMAEWVFYVSTVFGLLILRSREPDLHRPYKPPTLLPVLFVGIGGMVIARSAVFAPVQSVLLLGLMMVGLAVGVGRGRLSSMV